MATPQNADPAERDATLVDMFRLGVVRRRQLPGQRRPT
jgi:hypothetical protein